MVTRPEGIVVIKTKFEFNEIEILELEVDLKHINYGKNGKWKRSNYSAEEIENVTRTTLDRRIIKESDSREYGNKIICEYFQYTNEYRLIFCICSDKPRTIGIITYFKESKK